MMTMMMPFVIHCGSPLIKLPNKILKPCKIKTQPAKMINPAKIFIPFFNMNVPYKIPLSQFGRGVRGEGNYGFGVPCTATPAQVKTRFSLIAPDATHIG